MNGHAEKEEKVIHSVDSWKEREKLLRKKNRLKVMTLVGSEKMTDTQVAQEKHAAGHSKPPRGVSNHLK